jgi:hypothetical protein
MISGKVVIELDVDSTDGAIGQSVSILGRHCCYDAFEDVRGNRVRGQKPKVGFANSAGKRTSPKWRRSF